MSDSLARALSAIAIKNAKPNASAYKLADGGGLYLLVQPNGSKLWRYKYRINGAEKKYSIGVFPDIGLSDARRLHNEARQLVAASIDPVEHRKADRAQSKMERRREAAGSFQSVADAWKAVTQPKLAASTVAQRDRELAKYVMQELQGKAIESIQRLQIHDLLRKVDSHAPETARNLRNYLNGIFEYAIEAGLVTGNPVPTTRVLTYRPQTPHLALPEKRLGEFLKSLEAGGMITQTKIAMKLILLTACRKAEAAHARWDEVDLKNAEWLIPAGRMKGRREHWIPLSRQCVAMLEELKKISTGDFLFPHRDRADTPMADRTLNAVLERIGFDGETKVHGLRSLFSTHFNEKGANPDVIERVLAHTQRDKVRAAYNRHEYKSERREILQRWADFIDATVAHREQTAASE